MSLRQSPQVPSAFEIRFSATDSMLEVFEIQSDQSSQNVPDPFKKRDKIPRSSGSIEQFSYNNHNNTVPSQTSPIVIKQRQRHHSESSSKKGISINSDQVSSSLKVKSSNAVVPEADKQQQQRINGVGKILNVERSSSLGNDMIMTSNNTIDDDPIIRFPNKRQRPKIDEITSEMEKSSNLGKAISNNNHQIMDLNGKADMVIPNNKKNTSKSTIKNKINNMPTNSNNNYKDDDKLLPKDGIATPPATPPRSPQVIPTISQKRSDDGIPINQINSSEESQFITPPSSSGSTEFINDYVSTESTSSITRPSKVSQSSRKRRGSHSPQRSQSMLSTKRSLEMSAYQAYQPPKKLQQPRGRRSSLVSGQIITSEQPQESFTTQSSNKSKQIQKSQSQSPITRSRIPRLSISSKERPIVAQKVSQGSLSSQGSNKFNESMEFSSSYPGTFKPESPHNIRSSKSRPIINTSFITDVEVGSESPTGHSPTNHSPTNHSPTNYSPTSHSPTSHSPTSHSAHQKKLISHDDVVIPTIAKRLKMKGQLHFVNHDALLGYSEEPEVITPVSENGYMDITDQVVNLFDGPKIKSHKRQSSIPDSQNRRQRKNSSKGHSRNSSKTHYIAPRKQLPQQTYEEVPSPTSTQFENSSEHSAPHNNDIKKRGRSRREEYIISVREDDDDVELIEPRSSMPLVPSEPSTVPAVQIESHDQIYQEKVEEPATVQIPVVQEMIYNPTPAEVITAPTDTSGKKKKDKKKKQKKGGSDNLDEEDKYVRRSRCRCAIQ